MSKTRIGNTGWRLAALRQFYQDSETSTRHEETIEKVKIVKRRVMPFTMKFLCSIIPLFARMMSDDSYNKFYPYVYPRITQKLLTEFNYIGTVFVVILLDALFKNGCMLNFSTPLRTQNI